MAGNAYRGKDGPDGNPLYFYVGGPWQVPDGGGSLDGFEDWQLACPLCGAPRLSPFGDGLPKLRVYGKAVPQGSIGDACDKCGDEYAPPELMAYLREWRAEVERECATVADDGPSDEAVEAVAHSPRKPFEWPADRLE